MSESMVERVAKAIKESTDNFERPVAFYLEPEALRRWEKANPDGDWPDQPFDELASYRIIARAAIEAMRPNVDMLDSACAAWVKLYPAFEGEKPQPKAGEVATTIFNAMIDAALSPAKVDEVSK